MPTGDLMRATIEGTFNNEPVVLDLGFASNSGAGTFKEDADALSAELIAALDLNGAPGGFMSPLSEHYVLSGVRIQDVNPGVAAGLVYSINNAGGNTTDDALPPQIALCVTWRTELKGKANRGRSYLTGFAEDSQTNGFWIGEIQTWADTGFVAPLLAAFGPVGTGNYALSVIHRQAKGAPGTDATATPIISATIHNEVRTLRRRGVGVRISRHRAP